jgi:cation diffusion facilitator CzcD-associated flavoprotein CzcO
MTSSAHSSISTPDVDVAIIGAGFSGLGMAIALQNEGKRSFAVLEKGSDVGGTWYANRYPGCACDVPSNLYSFSFAPNPQWSRAFSPQPEIFQYLRGVADTYDLRKHIRFKTEVSEARFDDAKKLWRLTMHDGASLTARILVSGQGALTIPAYPKIEGLETFAGDKFQIGRAHV